MIWYHKITIYSLKELSLNLDIARINKYHLLKGYHK